MALFDRLTHAQRYWLLHITGWCIWLFVYWVDGVPDEVHTVHDQVRPAIILFCGIACSHAYRKVLHARAIRIDSVRRSALVAFVGLSICGSFTMGLLLIMYRVFGYPSDFEPYTPWNVVLTVPTVMLLFLPWFFLYHAYRYIALIRIISQDKAEARMRAHRLEADLLRQRLNSHFLFNAINSVKALIHADTPKAESALTDLADLLRGILKHTAQEELPLHAELELVERYLRIEELRFGTRLRYTIVAAPEVLDRPVPPMSVLTLVEDAVKHGVNGRYEGGCVAVHCSLGLDGGLSVAVTNPAPEGTGASTPSLGLGSKNLQETLAFRYGHRAKLVRDTDHAGQVRHSLHLPALLA